MIHFETLLVCPPSNYSLSLIVQWGNDAGHKQGEVGAHYLYALLYIHYWQAIVDRFHFKNPYFGEENWSWLIFISIL